MPLFSGNVWKVCAQPSVMSRRYAISPLKPAPKVALIGKTQRGRDINGLIPSRQQLPRFGQPQLDKPGMRGQMELALEAAREREAIGAGHPGEVGEANVVTQMGIQIIPRPMGHRRALQR